MEDTAHPLEDVFGIAPGSTYKGLPEVPQVEAATLVNPNTGEVVERKVDASAAELDREERIEDLHVDNKLEKVYGAALDAFEAQYRLSQEVDPKFSARNAEVAAAFLKLALDSVDSRVDSKYKRAKLRIARQSVSAPRPTQQNIIVADRNAMLNSLFAKAEEVKE